VSEDQIDLWLFNDLCSIHTKQPLALIYTKKSKVKANVGNFLSNYVLGQGNFNSRALNFFQEFTKFYSNKAFAEQSDRRLLIGV
jgi:hypothetical protein